MTSLITKEEFKEKLFHFIRVLGDSSLDELKEAITDPKNIQGNHPTTPGPANLESISSTGETAFQRGIFNCRHSLLDFKRTYNTPEKVTWLDLELPVTFSGSQKRRCIDLMGVLDGIPVICELKYSENSPSNHPAYAMIELLMYYYFIRCNIKKLDQHNVHHKNAKSFDWKVLETNKFPKLIIAANKAYWDYWFQQEDKKMILKLVRTLNEELDTNLHLFKTEDEDFKAQKNNKDKYKPMVTSHYWEIIKQN